MCDSNLDNIQESSKSLEKDMFFKSSVCSSKLTIYFNFELFPGHQPDWEFQHHTEKPKNNVTANAMTATQLKKGSQPISRVLSRAIIHLGNMSPCTSSDLPGDSADHALCPPIWSCSEWGFPCHNCYQLRGALLPHHFTLTGH